jgi:hypothetical protein
MPSLARGGGKGGLGRNLLIGGVVVVFVVALVFLPEIFQSSNDNGKSYLGMDNLFEKSERGEASSSRAERQDDLEADGRASLAGRERIEVEVSRPVTTEPVRPAIFKDGSLSTWDGVLASENVSALQAARRESLALAQDLAPEFTLSRFALLNYANAIDNVLQRGANGVLSPNQVVQYLSQADQQVSMTLRAEQVSRSHAMRWTEVTLGPQLHSAMAMEARRDMVGPFNPRITLRDVIVIQPSDSQGRYVPGAEVNVRLSGSVTSNEIRKLTYYRSDMRGRANAVPLGQSQNAQGRRDFNINFIPNIANVIITFEAIDTEGNKHRKSYNFYPRALRFPWMGPRHQSTFGLPYAPGDPRIDRIFAMGGARASKVADRHDLIGRF